MAIKTVFVCDVCGVQRGDLIINHWFTIRLKDVNFSGLENEPQEFICKAGLDSRDEDVKHVCGAAHANTLFNKFIQYGALEEPPVKEIEVIEVNDMEIPF